ncbi:MAG: MFS transporter [Terrimicrobiaceae bacterium]
MITTLAVFMVSLDATVVVAVFPALRQTFAGAPDWMLSWILNAYTIVYAALLIPAGRWGDGWGHRRSFLTGLAVFTLSSGWCALAPSVGWLIGGRIVQAVGAALLTPAALALALEVFPAQKRPFVVGLWSAIGAMAATFGPAAGSWLVDLTTWSAIFWINLPVGLLAWGMGAWMLPVRSAPWRAAAADVAGSILLIAGAGTVCLGIVRLPNADAQTTLETLLFGAGLLVVFAIRARRHPLTARDFSIFNNRNVVLANAATLLFGAAFGMIFLSFFSFTTGVWRFSQSLAGLAAVPGPLLVVPCAVLAGRLAVSWGQRPLLLAGGLLFAAAHLWYLLRVTEQPAYLGTWLPGQLVTGMAIGLVLPSLTSQALAGLAAERLGFGSAVNSAFRQMGGAAGVAVTVAFLAHEGLTLPAFRVIYLLLFSCGLGVVALALGIKRTENPEKITQVVETRFAQTT